MTVPNAAADVATFGVSNVTAVGISANTTVSGITFDSGGSGFTITVQGNKNLTFEGTGITNNSGVTQNFVAQNVGGLASFIFFESDNSTAGSMTHFTNTGATTAGGLNSGTFFDGASSTAGGATFVQTGGTASNGFGGFVQFEGASSSGGTATFINQAGSLNGGGGFTEFDGDGTMAGAATAGTSTITNDGGATSGAYGQTYFTTFSTAANATITNSGGTGSGAEGGLTQFFGSSTAGSSTITTNAGTVAGAIGGLTEFSDTSKAGNATLIANGGVGAGGTIHFIGSSTGDTARVEVFNNGGGTPGNLDISGHTAPGVTIGSVEGSGNVFLGNRTLTVGSNNLSTTFSGVAQDGGISGGIGGALAKTGTGTLSLTNSNTYTGGTLINAGTLIAGADGALGTGNVSLTASGVTLTLQNGATNNYISNTATISIVSGATANLNFTGSSDVVGGIVLNGAVQTAAGTYGAIGSGADFESTFFSGMGTLQIPEPSTSLIFCLGAAILVAIRLRVRRS